MLVRMTASVLEHNASGRSWRALLILSLVWMAIMTLWVALQAAGFVVALLMLATLPAAWDFANGRQASLRLDSTMLALRSQRGRNRAQQDRKGALRNPAGPVGPRAHSDRKWSPHHSAAGLPARSKSSDGRLCGPRHPDGAAPFRADRLMTKGARSLGTTPLKRPDASLVEGRVGHRCAKPCRCRHGRTCIPGAACVRWTCGGRSVMETTPICDLG